MSKARLVITAVVVEGRSQSEVAKAYGVSKGWVSKLVARYRAEGDAAFEPRSRRPRRSPTATAPEAVERIVRLRKELLEQGLDAGADTIVWHLTQLHGVRVSRATVHRQLVHAGLVIPSPRKRPRSSYVRFQAEQPNECWQADFTHLRLADGTDVEVLCWLDDHSRYALSVTAHTRVTGPIVLRVFRETITRHGMPASTLTDNGMVFTTRLAGGRGGRNAFETELARRHIIQKNSRPNHPTTCGKSNGSTRRSSNGCAPAPPPTPPPSCNACSTSSSSVTTTTAPTDRSHTKPPPPSSTTPVQKRHPPASPTRTTASATTASTTPAP